MDWIYYNTRLEKAKGKLPGVSLHQEIESSDHTVDVQLRLERKLQEAGRKLCLMWQASELAIEAEQEFYAGSIKDSPCLFGDDAVQVNYHLEALVLFARSALDVAAYAFGFMLPTPFKCDRFDSFNSLTKEILKQGPEALQLYLQTLRSSQTSWLSILSGEERGRSLRDKITHQTGFPIGYKELHPPSEKESAVVLLGGDLHVPLPEFVGSLREGVLEGFAIFENCCLEAARATMHSHGDLLG